MADDCGGENPADYEHCEFCADLERKLASKEAARLVFFQTIVECQREIKKLTVFPQDWRIKDWIADQGKQLAELKQVVVNLKGAREIAGDDGCDVTATCSECGIINRYQSLASVELEKLKVRLKLYELRKDITG